MKTLEPIRLRQTLQSGKPAIGTCAYSFSVGLHQECGC